MKPIPFFISLLLATICISWFAHHTVKTSLPRQILDTYKPDSFPHCVFLGSSLSDAGIDELLIDSVMHSEGLALRSFNCSLAGLSGDASYYLVLKKWILRQGRPSIIVLEVNGFPFADSKKDYKLLRPGASVDLIFPEIMNYDDYTEMCGGSFRPLETAEFFLNKYSFLYHNRLRIQGKILERLPFETHVGHVSPDPYHMKSDAAQRMRHDAEISLAGHYEQSGDFNPVNRTGWFEDIVKLAEVNGVQLVVFRPPFPPGDSVFVPSANFQANRKLFRTLCDSIGIVTWDCFGDSSIPGLSTVDGIHLDRQSALMLSLNLATRIKALAISP